MNINAALKGVIVPLACAAVLSCVPAEGPTELKAAAKDKSLALSLTGSEYVGAVNLSAKNNGKKERSIRVPVGAVLAAEGGEYQPMLVSADTDIVLAPDEEKSVVIPAFSLSYIKQLAGAEDSYAMKSYKLTKDPALKKILAYLASESGKADYPQDNPEFTNIVQQAVWLVTDGIDYDANIVYIIDSMIFSSVFQANPIAVTLMLDEGVEITDEASAQEAIFDLVMDKAKLHEKLQVLLGEDYGKTVDQIKASIEEQAGPEYRKSVNEFVDKAGLDEDY